MAVDRQLDELGHDAAEIDGRVGRVGRRAGRLGEFRHAFQRRPRCAVLGVLDRDGLGAEAEEAFDQLVRVPDQHVIELVDLVELVLDPGRLGAVGHPHLRRLGGVLVLGVEAGAVDRVLRVPCRPGAGGRGGHAA